MRDICVAILPSVYGTAVFEGRADKGQIGHSHTFIMLVAYGDTVTFNSNDNFIFKPGTELPVRYHKTIYKSARIGDFYGLGARTFFLLPDAAVNHHHNNSSQGVNSLPV